MIYCDYAATTPIMEDALSVYMEISRKHYGNASSLHDIGSNAASVLENGREMLATTLQTASNHIYYTSGGTEGNRLAIDTLLRCCTGKKHVISTMMEHSSVYYHLKNLHKTGDVEVTFLTGDKQGLISLEDLAANIRPDTCLVSIQHVNGETGVIQPIEQIGLFLRKQGIYFHSDCVQSFGKIKIDLANIAVDAITISSHKIFGPKGVGAVYFHPRVVLIENPVKMNNEKGIRPGTVDVASATAFAFAADYMHKHLAEHLSHLQNIKKYFIEQLAVHQLPLIPVAENNISCPSIVGCLTATTQGDYILLEYNRYGIAISSGSACSLGQQQIPRAIMPLLHNKEDGNRYIRFSFSHLTTFNDIDQVIDISAKIFSRIKEEQSVL
ncbi:aminotransferase class V-fold PLP-dependent enzyme [Gracilibacillus oryzae]|uniref:Aminotransferase class V-fold PLP-dependent enzyme n=1 Tax=Gracilibacillus oryzae TaxID=1672701 RepID=A0A7C8GTP0_9BACI|nr:IscS subfamily cysteine desulfurase [Gracilibacillus oryzae]KAB8134743.1 aminotransferase class V-fold PLP-dependent enzyme [Gracilibacillus oryzae]